jgi:hypothetical protein
MPLARHAKGKSDTKSRLLTPDSNADPAQPERVESSIRLEGFSIRIGYEAEKPDFQPDKL